MIDGVDGEPTPLLYSSHHGTVARKESGLRRSCCLNDVVAVCCPADEFTGTDPADTLEVRRQVALIAESNLRCHIGQGGLPIEQQFPGA